MQTTRLKGLRMNSEHSPTKIPLWQELAASSLATVFFPFQVVFLLLAALALLASDVELGKMWKDTRKFFLRTLFRVGLEPRIPKGVEANGLSNPGLTQVVLIGQVGVAVSDLKPTGMITINKVEHYARAGDGFIPKGEKIVVTSVGVFEVGVRRS